MVGLKGAWFQGHLYEAIGLLHFMHTKLSCGICLEVLWAYAEILLM